MDLAPSAILPRLWCCWPSPAGMPPAAGTRSVPMKSVCSNASADISGCSSQVCTCAGRIRSSRSVRSPSNGFVAWRSGSAPPASGNRPVRWESSHGRADLDESADEALLLTGDGGYVEVSATLQFAIDHDDPESIRRYVFEVGDIENALRPLAESAVREVVGHRPLLDLLREGRREAEISATELLQERLRAYRFGIVVRNIAFQDIHPPWLWSMPIATYRARPAIASAGLTRPTPIATRTLAEAKGKAQATIQAALADQGRRLALAGGEADAFSALRAARQNAAGFDRFPALLGEVADVLGGKSKVILDEEPGRRRHLIVPSLPLEKFFPLI